MNKMAKPTCVAICRVCLRHFAFDGDMPHDKALIIEPPGFATIICDECKGGEDYGFGEVADP